MNIIIDDLEILRVLLSGPAKSMYVLEREIKGEPGEKSVNYPTLRRHILELVEDGLIEESKGKKKNGRIDRRKTKILQLTYKGLVFLALNADLEPRDFSRIVNLIIGKHYPRFRILRHNSLLQIPITSFENMFKELRPRVNLEYFDEEYVKKLVFEMFVIENIIQKGREWQVGFKKKSTSKMYKRIIKDAKLDLKRIPKEWPSMLDEVYDYLITKRKDLNGKINFMSSIIKVYKKAMI